MALHLDRGAWPAGIHGLKRAVHNRPERLRARLERKRPRKIQEAAHQAVHPVHFAGDVARHLRRHRVGRLNFFRQRFGGTFDDAERVPQFVREAGGKLSERREALRTAGFRLRLLEPAVRFLQRQPLAPVLGDEGHAIPDHDARRAAAKAAAGQADLSGIVLVQAEKDAGEFGAARTEQARQADDLACANV